MSTEADLLAASDADLRALSGSIAVISAEDERVLIVTGAGAPTTLYVASSPEIVAWSSHAVAAAFLAFGEARIDHAAIPELLATDLVGGGRCLIEAVEPVPPATAIEVTTVGHRSRSFWPSRERWQPVSEDEARERAAVVLVEEIRRRVADCELVWLGLTGGLDSRVTALALKDAGVPFRCFTWGTEGPDLDGAREVARVLRVEHRTLPFELWDDEESLSRTQASTRWHEGAIHLGFGRPRTPADLDVQVMGGGGEVGRAFYYRQASSAFRDPSPAQCIGLLERLFAPRLAGAPESAHYALRRGLARWVAAAQESGLGGWRLLDVAYAEQRMQRWGRAMLPMQCAPVVHAFASPSVMRALCSLPLCDRVSDGFHRRFVGSRAPRLAPPPVPTDRGYQPARAMARRLRYRPAFAMAQRVQWRALGSRRRRLLRATGVDANATLWRQRPRFQSWIADDVLGSQLLGDVMGERWIGEVRRGFLAAEANAVRLVALAAGPVALESGLLDLRATS